MATHTDLSCPTCHSAEPKTRSDAAGNIVERCVEPTHAGFARTADTDYQAAFRAKRQAELDAERRAPESKAIADLYWELSADEYDEALQAVGLSR